MLLQFLINSPAECYATQVDDTNRERCKRYRQRVNNENEKREHQKELEQKERDRSKRNLHQRYLEKQRSQVQHVLLNKHQQNTSNISPTPIAEENIQAR